MDNINKVEKIFRKFIEDVIIFCMLYQGWKILLPFRGTLLKNCSKRFSIENQQPSQLWKAECANFNWQCCLKSQLVLHCGQKCSALKLSQAFCQRKSGNSSFNESRSGGWFRRMLDRVAPLVCFVARLNNSSEFLLLFALNNGAYGKCSRMKKRCYFGHFLHVLRHHVPKINAKTI